MLVLILHKDVHFLQNAKNLCYCQLIKGQRGSCSCSLAGETSQELTPRAAQYPWYSLARGGRAVGWNSEYQEEPLCFLAQSRCLSSALALPFSAFSACPQGRLDWCGFFASLLYQPSSSEWGKGHLQMGSAAQLGSNGEDPQIYCSWFQGLHLSGSSTTLLLPGTFRIRGAHIQHSVPTSPLQQLKNWRCSTGKAFLMSPSMQNRESKVGRKSLLEKISLHIPMSRSRQRISEVLCIFEMRKLNAQH